MSHKTEKGLQEALMSSGNTECSYKPAPQYSPDDLGIYSSSNVETSGDVMHFIKRLTKKQE